jgi:hypothetical protein
VIRRALLLLLLLLSACDGGEGQDPTIEIPATWKEQRRGTGHLAHLREEVKCRDCHAIEGSGFDRPSAIVCAKCHETVRDLSHRSKDAPQSDCYACHEFAEKSEVSKGACVRCHDEPRTHGKEDCLACHAPHRDPPLAIDGCIKCHEQEQAFVHTKLEEVEGCSACHVGHEKKAAAAKRCASCHEEKSGAPAIGHDDCTTCHTPHRLRPSCQSCHEKVRRDRHEDCSTCHQSSNTCSSCHADLLIEHGEGSSDCASCHPPHREREQCSKCHTEAKSDRSHHSSKLACNSCHAPHQFSIELLEGESCAQSCHPQQEKAVIGAHRDCVDCHLRAPHRPQDPVSCARCHEVERRSAPEGHRQCVNCHEPHSGRILPAATCESCHVQPVNIHTEAGDCSTCHAAHGPEKPVSPANCSTCHSSLPELHAEPKHRDCATCHRPHEKAPRRDRALCDACHRLPNHEPKVATCVGCHPFR